MNSLERVIAVLKGDVPDRVPVFEWTIDKKIIEAICPGGDIEDCVEKIDLDAIVIAPNERKEWLDPVTYRDEWGVIKKDTGESYSIAVEYPIKTVSDLQRYVPPDPDADYRFDSLKHTVRRFKGRKAIIVKLRDVFSQPRDLRGFENFLMDFMINPVLLGEIMDLSINYYSRLARRAVKFGADIIHTGDDMADNRGPFVSPKHFKELVYPKFKKIVSNFKDTGAYYIKHTDGNIWSIIDMLVDSGIDMLDPIDPVAGMDIGKVKRKYGNKIGIKGNVDCAGVLQNGRPEEVIRATKDCIKIASHGGRHILSSSNSIHSGVPPQNFIAMVQTVHEFGKYPLTLD